MVALDRIESGQPIDVLVTRITFPESKPNGVSLEPHAGRPVKTAERGSTLAVLVEATVRRITAAAASPTGCPCSRCVPAATRRFQRMRRTAIALGILEAA